MKDLFISSGDLGVQVNALGAELKSVTLGGTEYLWQGDKDYYARTSPTLFPIIGRFLSDTYYVGDTAYRLPLNGFAMDENFAVEGVSANEARFLLTASQRTKAAYPFDFALEVTYAANANRLTVGYRVENLGESDMPFGVGCHTAYRWPLAEGDDPENSYLRFEREELLQSFNPFGWRQMFVEGDTRPLSHELFRNATRSITDIHSEWIALQSTSHPHGVKIYRQAFPFLAIWSLPDPDATLVCLEPCTSIHSGDRGCTRLQDREGSITLSPGAAWSAEFSVEFF